MPGGDGSLAPKTETIKVADACSMTGGQGCRCLPRTVVSAGFLEEACLGRMEGRARGRHSGPEMSAKGSWSLRALLPLPPWRQVVPPQGS